HRAGEEAFLAQVGAGAVGELEEPPLQLGLVPDVHGERLVPADGFRLAVWHDVPVVHPPRPIVQPAGLPLAQPGDERRPVVAQHDAVEPVGAGEVEVELVARRRPDDRREPPQHLADVPALGGARLPGDRDDHRFGAEPQRAGHRHGGMHAEPPRLVGGRRDDAAAVGRAADDEAGRPSRAFGVQEAGHRDVERVGVGEEDAPVGLTNGLVHRYNDSRPCPTREDTAVLTLTPWVARLLFLNIGVFFLEEAYPAIGISFALVPAQLGTHPWTILTYMFLHANFSHLLFNMLGLYFFG